MLSGCEMLPWSDDSLIYSGFRIRELPNGWYINEDEQFNSYVLIRRSGPTLTYSLFVEIQLLGNYSISNIDSLENVITNLYFKVNDTNRFQIVDTSTAVTNRYNADGIDFYVKVLDKNAPTSPGTNLIMIIKGFSCMNPRFDHELFIALYSERGQSNEVNSLLVDQANYILQNVELTYTQFKWNRK